MNSKRIKRADTYIKICNNVTITGNYNPNGVYPEHTITVYNEPKINYDDLNMIIDVTLED